MEEVSAGVIVEREGKYLLARNFRNEWGFPKGHIEENETAKQAAVRECLEETGISVEIIDSEEKRIEYPMKNGTAKIVVYFIAKYVRGEFKENREVQEIEWLSFDDAYARISFDDMRDLFSEIVNGHITKF